MTQGGYQVIIISPIKSKMAAANVLVNLNKGSRTGHFVNVSFQYASILTRVQ